MSGSESNRRFQATPFTPDGGFEAGGVVTLFGALALLGAAIGYGLHVVSAYFYMMLLFPIAVGLVIGFVGTVVAAMTKLRNPWLGGLAGLAAGAFAMLTMHYADYAQFKSVLSELDPSVKQFLELDPAIQQESLNDMDPVDKATIEQLIAANAASGSFVEYMKFSAQQGVTMERAGRSDGDGLKLGYEGTFVYWGAEILLIGFIGLTIIRRQTRQPFCVPCSKWKEEEAIGAVHGDKKVVQGAVDEGNLTVIEALRQADPSSGPAYHFSLFACSGCKTAGSLEVRVEEHKTNKKGQIKETHITTAKYPGQAQAAWKDVFRRADAPAEDQQGPDISPVQQAG